MLRDHGMPMTRLRGNSGSADQWLLLFLAESPDKSSMLCVSLWPAFRFWKLLCFVTRRSASAPRTSFAACNSLSAWGGKNWFTIGPFIPVLEAVEHTGCFQMALLLLLLLLLWWVFLFARVFYNWFFFLFLYFFFFSFYFLLDELNSFIFSVHVFNFKGPMSEKRCQSAFLKT